MGACWGELGQGAEDIVPLVERRVNGLGAWHLEEYCEPPRSLSLKTLRMFISLAL